MKKLEIKIDEQHVVTYNQKDIADLSLSRAQKMLMSNKTKQKMVDDYNKSEYENAMKVIEQISKMVAKEKKMIPSLLNGIINNVNSTMKNFQKAINNSKEAFNSQTKEVHDRAVQELLKKEYEIVEKSRTILDLLKNGNNYYSKEQRDEISENANKMIHDALKTINNIKQEDINNPVDVRVLGKFLHEEERLKIFGDFFEKETFLDSQIQQYLLLHDNFEHLKSLSTDSKCLANMNSAEINQMQALSERTSRLTEFGVENLQQINDLTSRIGLLNDLKKDVTLEVQTNLNENLINKNNISNIAYEKPKEIVIDMVKKEHDDNYEEAKKFLEFSKSKYLKLKKVCFEIAADAKKDYNNCIKNITDDEHKGLIQNDQYLLQRCKIADKHNIHMNKYIDLAGFYQKKIDTFDKLFNEGKYKDLLQYKINLSEKKVQEQPMQSHNNGNPEVINSILQTNIPNIEYKNEENTKVIIEIDDQGIELSLPVLPKVTTHENKPVQEVQPIGLTQTVEESHANQNGKVEDINIKLQSIMPSMGYTKEQDTDEYKAAAKFFEKLADKKSKRLLKEDNRKMRDVKFAHDRESGIKRKLLSYIRFSNSSKIEKLDRFDNQTEKLSKAAKNFNNTTSVIFGDEQLQKGKGVENNEHFDLENYVSDVINSNKPNNYRDYTFVKQSIYSLSELKKESILMKSDSKLHQNDFQKFEGKSYDGKRIACINKLCERVKTADSYGEIQNACKKYTDKRRILRQDFIKTYENAEEFKNKVDIMKGKENSIRRESDILSRTI